MISPLLMTKVYIPPTSPTLVARPRLLTALDVDLARPRMTLLSAPAGYGKTTLVAAWIAYRREQENDEGLLLSPDEKPTHFAWYTLDEDDNDVIRFLTYFSVALQHVAPEASEDSLVALQSHRPPSTTALLATFLNEIDTRRIPVTLVFDDYHHIHGQAVHDAMAFLIEHLPNSLYLILMGRADPPLPLALLRGRGRLHDIRQAELQFTPDETETFLSLTCDTEVPPEIGAALTACTEGWVAGLQMAVASMQQKTDMPTIVAHLTGKNRHILDFFIDEVINRQPPAVRTFLLRTSILKEMNGSLCDAVVGPLEAEATAKPPDGQAMLDYLERANLFVIPQDDERRWYRYHRLFRDLLIQELNTEESELIPVLHWRASQWYAAHELPRFAIDHALTAGEYALAIELIDAQAQGVMMRSETFKLRQWLAALPEHFLSNQPRLLVYRAALNLLGGQPMERVESDLDAARKIDHDQMVAGAMSTLRGLIAAYQNRIDASLKLMHQALLDLPVTAYFWRGLAAGILGMNHAHNGDLQHATDAVLQALDVAERTNNIMNRAIALCRLGDLAILDCRLDDARDRFEQALARSMRNGRALPIAGMAHIGLGRLHLEHGVLEDAIDALERGIGLIHAWGDAGAIVGQIWLAATQTLRRDWDAAEEALHNARQLAIQFDAMTMDDRLVEWQQVELWLSKDDRQAAVAWLDRQLTQPPWLLVSEEKGVNGKANLLSSIKTIAMARVCLYDHRPGPALSLLTTHTDRADRPIPRRMAIDARLLEALALHDLGRPIEARRRFAIALREAAPNRIVRPFLTMRAPVEEMLSAYSFSDTDMEPFVAALREHLIMPAQAPSPGFMRTQPVTRTEAPSHLASPLTAREREVLALVAAGATNREISAELVVSLSTVKTHINNIYRKLDVHTRTGALASAHRIGLV